MCTHLSGHGGSCCAEKCFSHRIGAALDVPVSPCITPVKWSVTDIQAVSPFVPSKSARWSPFLDESPANEKSAVGVKHALQCVHC